MSRLMRQFMVLLCGFCASKQHNSFVGFEQKRLGTWLEVNQAAFQKVHFWGGAPFHFPGVRCSSAVLCWSCSSVTPELGIVTPGWRGESPLPRVSRVRLRLLALLSRSSSSSTWQLRSSSKAGSTSRPHLPRAEPVTAALGTDFLRSSVAASRVSSSTPVGNPRSAPPASCYPAVQPRGCKSGYPGWKPRQ